MHRRRTTASRPAHGGKGGLKPPQRAVKSGYQAPSIPPTLIAEVVNLGAHLRGRILHKELAGLEWQLQSSLVLEGGQFVQGQPHESQRNLLVVEKLVPPETAATAAAIANHALPTEFTATELKEAAALPAYKFDRNEAREDWRALPFITIDGEDARDFDDAVWATTGEAGGYHARVAIADVAFYVAAGSALEKAALERSNSTYFPNRVLPMLPERLSNDLCSLNPHTDKPVLAAELWLDNAGNLQYYRICRAVIHSAKRCTYTEIQAHLEKQTLLPANLHQPLLHLQGAFKALLTQREARGAISLEIPEIKLQLNNAGKVSGAAPRPRQAAHMLIEELMICANVAAATALSTGCADTCPGHPRKHHAVGGVYRVHAQPSKEKQETLRTTLAPLGFTAPPPNARPAMWNALAKRVQGHPAAPTLQRALLQAQMQAQYKSENIGHFGLALNLYTHFTSPIRRYADLLVHRALLKIMEGAAKPDELAASKLEATCTTLNLNERRSQQAEWEARDRMVAGWLQNKVGETFTATITNVAPFGCFLSLEGGIAEALLPKWHLEDYVYIGGQNAFRKTKGAKGLLRVGSKVAVKLLQADFAAGRLTVGLVTGLDQKRL